MYILWIYLIYHTYINIKKGTEQTHKCFTWYIPYIWMRTPYGWNIPCIYHVYTMYIPCIYQSGCDIPVIYQTYSLYLLHCLSFVYTLHIQYICIVYPMYIPGICIVYLKYIPGIYSGYTWYMIRICM